MKKVFFWILILLRIGLSSQNSSCYSIATVPPTALPSGPTSSSNVKVFPVIVHVIYNVPDNVVGVGSNISDAQVFSAIQNLNDAYRNASGLSVDMEVEFCLAKVDANGNPTNGIDRIRKDDFPSNPNFVICPNSSIIGSELEFITYD